MHRRALIMIVCVALLVATIAAGAVLLIRAGPAAPAGYQAAALAFHHDPYGYLVYLPHRQRPAEPAPLLVVLHGCQTTAAQQASVSEYAPLADRQGLIVLYPDVDASDVSNGGCWKGVWKPGGEGVDRGDAGAIAAMTQAVMRAWPVDRRRVYLIGMSAGAFEASIVGAAYPNVYAAIGIHSGAAYMDGLTCVDGPRSAIPTGVLARAALHAMAAHARVMPVIVIHGDRDERVPYRCGRQALAQWLATDNLALAREHRPAIASQPAAIRIERPRGQRSYTVTSYVERDGCPIAQLWTVHGMGHAWSGGTRAAALAHYSDPLGPSAAAASIGLFLRWRLDGACSTS